jgi:hypothetical protein
VIRLTGLALYKYLAGRRCVNLLPNRTTKIDLEAAIETDTMEFGVLEVGLEAALEEG